jgi:hypothetical protein
MRLIAAASTNTPVERDWRFASLATREASQAKQPRRNPAVTAVSEDTAIVAVRPGATCAVHPAGEDAANDLPETLQRARPGPKSKKRCQPPSATACEVLRSALRQRMVTFHAPSYGNVGRVETCLGEDIMRKLLAVGGAAALALWALAASADEVTGTISNIDLTRNTFVVEGKTFTASPSNTVGVKLSELKEGDKVRVDTQDTTATKEPYNAMSLQKVE